MKNKENTTIDDETLPVELEFRVSSMMLILGVVIIGLDLLGISTGRSPILLLWISGAGLIGSYFYFRSVPAIRMSQDRVEYAVAPLRSTEVLRRDEAARYEYKKRNLLGDQYILHRVTGSPIKIMVGHIKEEDRPKLARRLKQFCLDD